jgi:hypothetical protein
MWYLHNEMSKYIGVTLIESRSLAASNQGFYQRFCGCGWCAAGVKAGCGNFLGKAVRQAKPAGFCGRKNEKNNRAGKIRQALDYPVQGAEW